MEAKKSAVVSATQDELGNLRERLDTLVSEMCDLANQLQGAFNSNDQITQIAGDIKFISGEISGEFSGAEHNWQSQLTDILNGLIAAGE